MNQKTMGLPHSDRLTGQTVPVRLRTVSRRSRGFSLFEIVVVLALAVIMATFAIAPLRAQFRAQQLARQQNELWQAITLAQHVAFTQQQNVVLCAAERLRCHGRNEWATGWLLFVDHNGDKQFSVDETRLQHWQTPLAGLVIRSNSLIQADKISFNAMGLTSTRGQLTFSLPGTDPRWVCIGSGTRFRVSSNGC